jgi:hypothetical protein
MNTLPSNGCTCNNILADDIISKAINMLRGIVIKNKELNAVQLEINKNIKILEQLLKLWNIRLKFSMKY